MEHHEHEDEIELEDEYKIVIREPLEKTIAREKTPEEFWLWCLHCCRFFQVKHLRSDSRGNREVCPFLDCGAAGLGLDIFPWDAFRDKRIAQVSSFEDLRYGMRSPW